MNGKAVTRPQKKSPSSGNSKGLAVKHERQNDNTNILVREVVTYERSYIAPICEMCGSFKNLAPFRVSSSESGIGYNFRWVCGNHNGEGNCPVYEIDGQQIVDLPVKREGTI